MDFNKIIRYLAKAPKMLFKIAIFGLVLTLFLLGSDETSYYALPGRETLSGIYHFIFYSFLTVLVWLSFRVPSRFKVIVVVSLVGVVDEGIQYLLNFRHASWNDWLIDVAAVVLTCILLEALEAQVRTGRTVGVIYSK